MLAKLKLPRTYTDLPVILLGRLAVHKTEKGKKYGALMLLDAFELGLKLSPTLRILAVFVDPIDENAVNFYLHYGFLELVNSKKMFIPMETIRG